MDVGALGRSVTAVLRGDAASCGLHLVVRTRQSDAGILPATFVEVWTVAGLFLAALRAAGIARHRRHPAASSPCAMDHAGAGHPCPAPFQFGQGRALARM